MQRTWRQRRGSRRNRPRYRSTARTRHERSWSLRRIAQTPSGGSRRKSVRIGSEGDESALYIDCSADGLAHRKPSTVFRGDHISLQTVRTCQPAFSASVIAHVESAYPDDDTRNAFCGPVPYPREPTDWL